MQQGAYADTWSGKMGTPYERLKGKKFDKEVAELGECVWWLKPKSAGKDKFESRWESGIWLGIRDESGEHLIGTKEGIRRARTIRRRGSDEERWNIREVDEMKGIPWEPEGKKEGTGVDVWFPKSAGPEIEVQKGEEEEVSIRRPGYGKRELSRWGYTVGCAGCKAVQKGKYVAHSEECRVRIEEKLKESGDPKADKWFERLGRNGRERLSQRNPN